MKIMYIIHSLVIGGAETIAVNYLIRLKEMGQDVVLLQMYDKKTFLNQRLKQNEVRVLTVCKNEGGRILAKIAAAINIYKSVRTENPDIIHVHTGLEKFRYIRYPAQNIIYTLHTDWKRCLKQGRNHKKMLFKLIRQGMTVVALSEKAKREVVDCFPNANVRVIPNGIDFDQVRKCQYNKKDFLRSLNIPETAFILGHVGRFHKIKNHEKIIDIFQKLLNRKEDAYLFLVGGGSLEEEERIHSLVEAKGLEAKVFFLGERQDATGIMSIFDCFILPSYSEAFPLVVVEAGILDIRSVVSEAVPEEVYKNVGCFRLSVEDDSEKWVDYIVGTDLPQKEETLHEFNIQNVIDKHMRLYRSLGRETLNESKAEKV